MLWRIRTWKLTIITGLLAAVLALPSCKKSEPESSKPSKPGTPAASQKQETSKKEEVTNTVRLTTPKQEEPKVSENPTKPATPAATSEKMVPLDIKLPKPMFVGTPTNIRGVEKLQKPLGKPRPPFLAPEGCKNVALDKKVTSSDSEPIIGDLELMTDGDKEGIDGSWVELGPMVQWAQIDLGAKYDIYAVLFWHYHRQACVYFDVIVQVADDPDFITNVRTIFNNDLDNSAGQGIGNNMHYIETSEGKLVDAKGIQARYVRLYSNGSNANDQNLYTEIEVYGKPGAKM